MLVGDVPVDTSKQLEVVVLSGEAAVRTRVEVVMLNEEVLYLLHV